MKDKILYIDIDGVLLGAQAAGNHEVVQAERALEFLDFALKYFDCYWLTTHSRDGDTGNLMNYLKQYCNDDFFEFAKLIKPTAWDTFKTEAVDFSTDFYWIDNQILQAEKDILSKHECLYRWIQVDTRKEPDGLKRVIAVLENTLRE